jgi:hypothetical protein
MNRVALALLILGLLQMGGDVLGRLRRYSVGQLVKGLGAAATASSAPTVFSAMQGFAVYSTPFTLAWTGRYGESHTIPGTRPGAFPSMIEVHCS